MATADDDQAVTFQADTTLHDNVRPYVERDEKARAALIPVRVAREKRLHLDTLESSSWPTDG